MPPVRARAGEWLLRVAGGSLHILRHDAPGQVVKDEVS
jgi:hypothetical protein